MSEIRRCPRCDNYTLRLRRAGLRSKPWVWFCDTCGTPEYLKTQTFFATERDQIRKRTACTPPSTPSEPADRRRT